MTTAQWVNAGPDDAALPALLERIGQRVPIASIDELWIFPTRHAQGIESTVIVVSTFDHPSPGALENGSNAASPEHDASLRAAVGRGGRAGQGERSLSPARGGEGQGEWVARASDRRRVNTAHFTANRDRKGRAAVEETIELHAIATADAVARVVEGVIRRLDDGLALPRSERIAGDPARWTALLEALDPTAATGPARQRVE